MKACTVDTILSNSTLTRAELAPGMFLSGSDGRDGEEFESILEKLSMRHGRAGQGRAWQGMAWHGRDVGPRVGPLTARPSLLFCGSGDVRTQMQTFFWDVAHRYRHLTVVLFFLQINC